MTASFEKHYREIDSAEDQAVKIRDIALVLAVICVACCPLVARGQQVKVVREPARQLEEGETASYDSWTVSYSRRFAPEVFALDSGHKSLESAQAAARRIQEWSNTIESSDWKVAVILLEGSPSYRKSPSGSTGSVVEQFVERAKGPVDQMVAEAATAAYDVLGDADAAMAVARGDAFDAGQVLGDYANSVEIAYGMAKQLKDKLLTLQADVADEALKNATDLIDKSLERDSALFLDTKQAALAKQIAVVAGQRSDQAQPELRDVLDRIGKASDPEEVGRLVEQLRALEEKGEVRELAIAEDAERRAEERASRLAEQVDALARIVEEGRQQQEEILPQFFGPKVADTVRVEANDNDKLAGTVWTSMGSEFGTPVETKLVFKDAQMFDWSTDGEVWSSGSWEKENGYIIINTGKSGLWRAKVGPSKMHVELTRPDGSVSSGGYEFTKQK